LLAAMRKTIINEWLAGGYFPGQTPDPVATLNICSL
jgi:hypothetical protein